jgi:hypothetical protein
MSGQTIEGVIRMFQGGSFIIAIIAISTLGWMFTTWVRARHGYPVENEWKGTVGRSDPDADRKIALLTSENEKLMGRIGRLEERIAVLERIATDPAARTAHAIEALR